MITEMEEYKLYDLCIWSQHRSTRGMVIDLDNFQARNITACVTAYQEIQERKDLENKPIVKVPSTFINIDKCSQLANIVWNCMSTHFIVDKTTPLVYLLQEEESVLSDIELNHMEWQDAII